MTKVGKANNLPNQKKYFCSFKNCGKTYALKNILFAHLRTHYKIKPFICPYCSKSFNEKGNLKTHIRIHTGERPFKCKMCKKSFKALGQLKDHFISHTGLKPFQCPFCKKYYRRKEILKNHFEIHKKDEFFLKNGEKYEEMLKNINLMKNMSLDLDDRNFVCKNFKKRVNNNNVNNFINSTGSGNETNLSYSISSNDDSKQSFCNYNKKEKTNNNDKKINNEKEVQENIEIDKKKFLVEKNEIKQKNNLNKSSNNNINKGLILPNNIMDFKLQNFIVISNALNSSLMEEKYKYLFYEEDKSIESNDFSFQKLPNITEKEISVSNNLNNYNTNQYYSEEKTEKNFESYDCYSKITNLYFYTHQLKMDINI